MKLHPAIYLGILVITIMTILVIGTSRNDVSTRQLTTSAAGMPTRPWWQFQSIDTMKFSRDPSRQYLSDLPTLQTLADIQLKNIADTGANYVAIDTPYDDEFLPVLTTWVTTARKYGMHVWFRGNWSGWEGWFNYPKISRADHLAKTQAFIATHSDLFQDGDIFSACPECENGGPGDPRQSGDVAGHRQFLISEYQMMTSEFGKIHKQVQVNFNSMNKDVASLVMDKATTSALGGLVVIDHYVKEPAQLNQDITDLAAASGGQIILGETGAPIPDIHGNLTDQEQADWLSQSLALLATNPALTGLNYWTSVGGSTAIWTDQNQPKPAVASLKKYFSPQMVTIQVTDQIGDPILAGQAQTSEARTATNSPSQSTNQLQLPYLSPTTTVTISAAGYQAAQLTIPELQAEPHVVLIPMHPSFLYQLHFWLKNMFG